MSKPHQLNGFQILKERAIEAKMAFDFPMLKVGAWVHFRCANKSGRITKVVVEYPHNYPNGVPYGVFLIRLDNGIFVTEHPEYLDPASKPLLKIVPMHDDGDPHHLIMEDCYASR